ncbi:hypothetical protein Q4I30_002034 [Leishmania utingensis]|uniref:Uncharacterized protein n=1 Tax=Leishmania utingensis TaxID=653362 RepID=A0AAW3AU04_9TRYP
MSGLEKSDIISTPMPFPTIPVKGVPQSERSWVENNWWVLLMIECLVLFAVFMALLVYYLFYVRTPGKRLLDDKVDNDGLSHYGSELSSRSSSVELTYISSSTYKRGFAENAVGGTVGGRKSHRPTLEVLPVPSQHSKAAYSPKCD